VLRITRHGGSGSETLRLEGRVAGPWVEVLRKAWSESDAPRKAHNVTIDLGEVTFADRDGRALLLELRANGAVFDGVSEFMRHILAGSGDDSDGKGE
jgi:ABC-type transporter Mla MlaB component